MGGTEKAQQSGGTTGRGRRGGRMKKKITSQSYSETDPM